MAIFLDDAQREFVAIRRRKVSDRPQYYSAALKAKVTVSEDFEAFLILQGRQRNQETVNWLELAQELGIRDGDRDALVAAAYRNDTSDAAQSSQELLPLVRLFNRFKETYQLTGFEKVTECGTLLADLQRPMGEIINLINRSRHRQQYATVGLDFLRAKGATVENQRQLNSWFSPLTSY